MLLLLPHQQLLPPHQLLLLLQTMRTPATERQLFLARQLAPYAPAYLVNPNSTNLLYRQATEHMLQVGALCSAGLCMCPAGSYEAWSS